MQSGYDQRSPTRFVFDKKKKSASTRRPRIVSSPLSSAQPTSFRGNDCPVLTGTLCLRVPFARAILSYKRSRTIELSVHHRFHLPRILYITPSSTLARISLESRVRYIVSAGNHLRPRKIRNWQAFVCMACVHRRSERTTGGVKGGSLGGMVGTALVVP